MKQFLKELDKEGDCFKYICSKFFGSTIEQLKTDIFDGFQIGTLMNDRDFPNSMNEKEFCAWSVFVETVKKFLGNSEAFKYKGIVANY